LIYIKGGAPAAGYASSSDPSVRGAPMIQHLLTASGPAFAPLVTGTFIVLMALLIGNAARLSRRQACRIRVRARRPHDS
jgi:hypothetical protein